MEQDNQDQSVQRNTTVPADTGPSPEEQGRAEPAGEQRGAEAAAPQQESGEGLTGDETTVETAEGAGQQPHHQYAQQPQYTQQPLPPGYAVDPTTGQIVFVGQPYQQPIYQQPVNPAMGQPGVVYVQGETPEQAAARQALEQQRYGQIMHSFEQFMQGEATVSDVVKTLYTNTAQYDQLWKGALVGAAATFLLTSRPAREAMGKTFGSVFPGVKPKNAEAAEAAATVDPTKTGKE
ncbi:hypothetical protein JWJ90_00865 [Desulfobulbus rhabdoformis]|uniref:hypothetical protein n=1 Tax=Desulfobulbus rhabdoformis TaxID=34032 RepID=UPI0019647642|nr:hypothetical protein [Desulfobulbus rhabdoformis]MBM9612831.1 hypothetical protein [Desulfobulbus rhabdoformis]